MTPNPHTTKTHSPSGLPSVLRLTGIWLIFVCWCQSSGWILSWFKALNTTGYLCTAPIAVAMAFWFWRKTGSEQTHRFSLLKWCSRAKKSPSIIGWSVVTILILIGAVINPPSNYDGICYRLPRLLYWLQDNQWHWIDGLDHRQNISGVGHEWMSVPFILFTQSDRGLFLINFLPFLLLPGLFFIAARGLGIRTGLAHWWMWVWPMAYGIALQAGSIGNDLVAVVLAIASLAFAAQAPRHSSFLCLFLSAFSAAAMTSIKATTLPLLLPLGCYWLWMASRSLPWRKTFMVGLSVLPIAAISSFVPIAIACVIHTGVWSGNPNNCHGAEPQNPLAGLIGNTIEFTTGLIQLPITPASSSINTALNRLVETQSWYVWVSNNYPYFALTMGAELPSEEHSGIGIGITMVGLVCIFMRKPFKPKPQTTNHSGCVFTIASTIAMLAYLSKAGMGGTARLTLPYTPVLMLSILPYFKIISQKRNKQFRILQILPAICLIPTLLLNPNRPIIPIHILTSNPAISSSLRKRMISVSETYQLRGKILEPLLKYIPQGETIGFAGGGDRSALALFKPYGTRKVINFSPRTENYLNWVVGTEDGIQRRMGMPLSQWESKSGYLKVASTDIVSQVRLGPETWHIYKKPIPEPNTDSNKSFHNKSN